MEILSTTGEVGDSIIISGNGMNYVDRVFFNGAAANFRVLSENYLYAQVPEDSSFGLVQVISDSLELTGYSDSNFVPVPRITTINPSLGIFLDNIVLSGFCFSGVTGVKIGEFTCPFSISGNNSIHFQVPSGCAKNKVRTLTYSGIESSSSRDFAVVAEITGFEYEKAFPGRPILIKGRYFDDHLLHPFVEREEYQVSLINSGEGLKYYVYIKPGFPTESVNLSFLKDSTYVFNFNGIESGDHFYFTKDTELSGEIFDLSSLNSEVSGFGGVITEDNFLYLLPQKFSTIVKVNSSGSFSSGQFEFLDLNSIYSGAKEFKGSLKYNNSGYLIPYQNGNMVRFGLGTGFGTGTTQVLNLASFNQGLSGFGGGFSSFNYGYLAPHINGKFTRVDLNAFVTGASQVTGISFIDLTLIDPELTGFVGAFQVSNQAVLVPNKKSKLVSIPLGYFDNPTLFPGSGVVIYNLDQYNYCDLIITGFFYSRFDSLFSLSGLSGPSGGIPGSDTGSISGNLDYQFSTYLQQGICGGPTIYESNQYKASEAFHSSEFSRVDLKDYNLIITGLNSGLAETEFEIAYQAGLSGNQSLLFGRLLPAADSAKILQKNINFFTGLNTGVYALSSGWIASGALREVYEIPYCLLVTSGDSEGSSIQAFDDRFQSGYCGSYLLTGSDRVYTGICTLYVSGTGLDNLETLFSGHLSSGSCSSDGFNFTYGNYLSGYNQELSIIYSVILQVGDLNGFAYSGKIQGLSGVNVSDGFSQIRTGDSFYGILNKQTSFVSGFIPGVFELIVTGLTQNEASSLFDGYFNSGISFDYREIEINNSGTTTYSPINATVEKDTILIQATTSEAVIAYGFSGSGFISSGTIFSKSYPYIFETGWITSGMISEGRDSFHRISGRIQKNVRDNFENFIGGFEHNGTGYLLPGATGSGHAQIFAFNIKNFDSNLNIDLTGQFTGDYNGGFQDLENGYFISKNSSKIFKFKNEYFDYDNVTSFDTRNILVDFEPCHLFITGSSSGEVVSVFQNYFSSGYCGSGSFTTGNYNPGDARSINSLSSFFESKTVCTGICSLTVRGSGFLEAEDLFLRSVASGACGDYISGYAFNNYNSGYNLCSGESRFLTSTFFESGGSGQYVMSGDVFALSGYRTGLLGTSLSSDILIKHDLLGFSAGATLGEFIYGIPHQNGVIVRYRNAFEPYLSGYTVSGDGGSQLKVLFTPPEELSEITYFASGNVEYSNLRRFNVVKSNEFLVQFFGSEGDEFFKKLNEFTLSGSIPTGALSGSILIARPDAGDGIIRYY